MQSGRSANSIKSGDGQLRQIFVNTNDLTDNLSVKIICCDTAMLCATFVNKTCFYFVQCVCFLFLNIPAGAVPFKPGKDCSDGDDLGLTCDEAIQVIHDAA